MKSSLLVLAFVVACASLGVARADTRPRVAILGLEVTSSVDPKTTELARDLTEGMRQRARIGSGPFAYAPSSERELIDEKLIKQCDNEAPACMSEIGKELDADILVYGKLERDDKAYRLTLHLLDVNKKVKLNRTGITIPFDGAAAKAKATARSAYEELTGASAMGGLGTVEIEANVDNGTVYVDDSSSEVLMNGRAKLTLPEGRYRIAVEAPGKQRKEISVTVTADQTISQEFDLVAGSSRPPSRGGTSALRYGSYVGGAVTGVMLLIDLYLLSSWHADAANIQASRPIDPNDPEPRKINENDCDGSSIDPMIVDRGGILATVCSTRDTQIKLAYATAAVGTVSLAAFLVDYFWWSKRSTESATRADRKRNARDMAITPVVTEDSAGALFRMTF